MCYWLRCPWEPRNTMWCIRSGSNSLITITRHFSPLCSSKKILHIWIFKDRMFFGRNHSSIQSRCLVIHISNTQTVGHCQEKKANLSLLLTRTLVFIEQSCERTGSALRSLLHALCTDNKHISAGRNFAEKNRFVSRSKQPKEANKKAHTHRDTHNAFIARPNVFMVVFGGYGSP